MTYTRFLGSFSGNWVVTEMAQCHFFFVVVILFVAMLALCGSTGFFSSCGAQASHFGGFFLQFTVSVVMEQGLSCSVACGIFPDQGLNPCLLRWQADSLLLSHEGNPPMPLLKEPYRMQQAKGNKKKPMSASCRFFPFLWTNSGKNNQKNVFISSAEANKSCLRSGKSTVGRSMQGSQ